jgi:hypothetical protein
MAEKANICALIMSQSLVVNQYDHEGQSCLIIQHRKLYNHPPF